MAVISSILVAQMASGLRLNTLTDHPRVLARTLPQAGAPTDHASDQPGHTEQNNG